MNDPLRHLHDLADRLTRLTAARVWDAGLNPAQRAALRYLARANAFSRAPSHVADYLCTTRGTASQTLKALEKKGLIEKQDSGPDRRSISYGLTASGRALAETDEGNSAPPSSKVEAGAVAQAAATLDRLLRAELQAQGGRTFGLCRTCRFHRSGAGGAHCTLLDIPLPVPAPDQLCHEHQPAA